MSEKELDRISYALGLSMGQNFWSSGIKKIDIKDFTDALSVVYGNAEPKMSHTEAKAEIQKFFEAMAAKQQEEMAAKAKINAEAGVAYLEKNKNRQEVKTTPSGLQYEILKEGNGKHPATTDSVTVHYTGKLIDGTVFDSSVERGEPATFGVTQVIPGWVEALQLMDEGAQWRLHIPANLAYGPNGAGPIGPNETLIFDIELIKIN
ncbi:MAG: FKBP-type peptidyl-prolyl cis-trans isomerase [Muribaculum sp.]|nr:FKBP-type peptidyl-prolyl cis-trans isomerase [Muribaculaceae bacterium]MCM1081128.1 FKBP-type peptidyl-prolyl cis-trans isomerase [Muribaculum sp.]MCM1255886.1 FKBP-type peptidyl-prolyl cis-trans isomerase [Duncaniella sp.]